MQPYENERELAGYETLSGSGRAVMLMASAAMKAAQNGEQQAAADLLQCINDTYGGTGLSLAMIGWIDHAMRAQGIRFGSAVEIHLWDDKLEIDAPDAPDTMRWASRMIQARAAFDRGRWETESASLDGADPETVGAHVMALLMSCASLRTEPQEAV